MHAIHKVVGKYIMERCDVDLCDNLILKHDLFNYFYIGNVNTQNNVDEPGPQLVVVPPPQGLFPLSALKKTLASREMMSRNNIKIFYFNGVNVAKHWHLAGRGICHL